MILTLNVQFQKLCDIFITFGLQKTLEVQQLIIKQSQAILDYAHVGYCTLDINTNTKQKGSNIASGMGKEIDMLQLRTLKFINTVKPDTAILIQKTL